jgi:V/A-type H+-transporting ATPase subunit K
MLLTKNLMKYSILMICTLIILVLTANTTFAQEDTAPLDLKPIGAALAVGISGIGAAFGMGMAGSAAIGAITEKPEVFGKAFLFIVLIEAVAIYGLLVAILLVL